MGISNSLASFQCPQNLLFVLSQPTGDVGTGLDIYSSSLCLSFTPTPFLHGIEGNTHQFTQLLQHGISVCPFPLRPVDFWDPTPTYSQLAQVLLSVMQSVPLSDPSSTSIKPHPAWPPLSPFQLQKWILAQPLPSLCSQLRNLINPLSLTPLLPSKNILPPLLIVLTTHHRMKLPLPQAFLAPFAFDLPHPIAPTRDFLDSLDSLPPPPLAFLPPDSDARINFFPPHETSSFHLVYTLLPQIWAPL